MPSEERGRVVLAAIEARDNIHLIQASAGYDARANPPGAGK